MAAFLERMPADWGGSRFRLMTHDTVLGYALGNMFLHKNNTAVTQRFQGSDNDWFSGAVADKATVEWLQTAFASDFLWIQAWIIVLSAHTLPLSWRPVLTVLPVWLHTKGGTVVTVTSGRLLASIVAWVTTVVAMFFVVPPPQGYVRTLPAFAKVMMHQLASMIRV